MPPTHSHDPTPTTRPLGLGVDIGGTFTDFFLLDPDAGTFVAAKSPSNRGAEAEGFLRGLEKLGGDAHGATIVHGTTVGTNALLERKGARIGVVLQESEPMGLLTVREALTMFAGYFPAPRPVAETIRLVGLDDQADQRAGRLSGGQQRRLDVALALIGDPELLFLDEPTTGFDPAARR